MFSSLAGQAFVIDFSRMLQTMIPPPPPFLSTADKTGYNMNSKGRNEGEEKISSVKSRVKYKRQPN